MLKLHSDEIYIISDILFVNIKNILCQFNVVELGAAAYNESKRDQTNVVHQTVSSF